MLGEERGDGEQAEGRRGRPGAHRLAGRHEVPEAEGGEARLDEKAAQRLVGGVESHDYPLTSQGPSSRPGGSLRPPRRPGQGGAGRCRARRGATGAARCVACQAVRSHPVPVALVAECSIPLPCLASTMRASAPHAAHCTARHGVCSHAAPPPIEWAMFTYSSDRLTAGGRGGESTRTERRRLRSAASGTREADWYIRPRRCARACSWLLLGNDSAPPPRPLRRVPRRALPSGARRTRRRVRVLHAGRVERRTPAALVVAREPEIEALARHADCTRPMPVQVSSQRWTRVTSGTR